MASNCHLCGSAFGTWTNRRHHCRICSQSVCSKCSPESDWIAGERSCSACVAAAAGDRANDSGMVSDSSGISASEWHSAEGDDKPPADNAAADRGE